MASPRVSAPSSLVAPTEDATGPTLPFVRIAHPHVTVDPGVLAGSPTIAGTRVPVRRLWAWHRGGTAVETLMRRYPQLGPAKVLDALSFAYDNEALVEADLAREQALLVQTAPTSAPPEGLRPMAQQALPLAAAAADTSPGARDAVAENAARKR